MKPFTTLTAIAVPIPVMNVDTDMLVPARFLNIVSKAGLSEALFNAVRFIPGTSSQTDHALNRRPWCDARILVALENFGCGSSREHAPWALSDFGIRCVIAPSFADIFWSNCFKNGILPITLDRVIIDALLFEVSTPEAPLFQSI